MSGLGGLAGGRPGSRAGPLMARPGTGMRMGTAMGMPPGTGMVPPGTGMGGGIPGVLDRPVTQQGMQGRPMTGMNTGRIIQDGSYWVSKVQEKMSELKAETERLMQEGQGMQKEYQYFVSIDDKKKGLEKDQARNEVLLAEFNLLVEKMHAGTSAEEILAEAEELKGRNAVINRSIASTFEQRGEVERHLNQEQSRIASHQQEMAHLINQLPQERAQLYFQLRESNDRLVKERTARTLELENLTQAVSEKERELASDPARQQAIGLQEEHKRLTLQCRELEEDMAMRASKDPAELMGELRAKMQSDNRDIEALRNTISEVQHKIDDLDEKVERRNADLKESTSGGEGNDKLAQLQKKEKEMLEQVASFPERKQTQEEQMKLKEGMIVQLLQQISRQADAGANMPTPEQLQQMVGDLEFKEQQRNLSLNTKKTLEADMRKYQDELDKIKTLDKKIGVELSQLDEKMAKWDAEMDKYNHPEVMLQENMAIMSDLRVKRERLSRYKAAGKDVVHDIQTKNNSKEKMLKESGVGQDLHALEKRLATVSGQVYKKKQEIAVKSRQSDYASVKAESLKIMAELNGRVTDAVHVAALSKASSATAY